MAKETTKAPHSCLPTPNPSLPDHGTKKSQKARAATLARCLTLAGSALLAWDVFKGELTILAQNHSEGIAGAATVALAITILLISRMATMGNGVPPDHLPSGPIDAEIIEKFPESKTALIWLRNEINYYRYFALRSLRLHWTFKLPSLIFAAVIPVFALLNQNTITAALAALIGISEGIMQIGQFRENWLRSAATRDQLEREIYLFASNASIYSLAGAAKTATATLTERVVSIIQNEQSQWLEINRPANQTTSNAAQNGKEKPTS
ncbi:DUF4231 domain-containing protein [Corallococcus sp. M34]|uniref:DUF4231 domain-containing protein n=1 Tax=Citreicoccus inhibens TaxID=2849499 RepID=UPI001C23CBC2|nr:DUF4231 domain-containing protein [Citreicoccus inhibens]MBU8900928.1 DUF4231 domain-containing protein [Citreicoccus inhibens]